MDLFDNFFDEIARPINILDEDGLVDYYGTILVENEADDYFHQLMTTIPWKNDQAHIFGKQILTKRKVAWYGEQPFQYTYSNTTKVALPWTKEVLALKVLAERVTGETYNACLLNLYHDGSEGMAWHSDGETDL